MLESKTCEVARDATKLESWIDTLQRGLSRIGDTVDGLQYKIEPVLSPAIPVAGNPEGAVAETGCSLETMLCSVDNHIRAINYRLTELRDRVAL